MNQIETLTPAALYARVSSDRQDVDLSVAAQLRALEGLRREERLHRGPRVRGRGRERPQHRPPRVQQDDRRRQQARFSLQGDIGLEILEIHPQAGARRGLQVHAPQAGYPGRLHHRARRRLSHRQADGGHHRVRGRILLRKFAEEVLRGMREAASRGFWISTYSPYGYRKVQVQDGAKKRPKLEAGPGPPTAWCAASSRWPCSPAPAPWTSPRP